MDKLFEKIRNSLTRNSKLSSPSIEIVDYRNDVDYGREDKYFFYERFVREYSHKYPTISVESEQSFCDALENVFGDNLPKDLNLINGNPKLDNAMNDIMNSQYLSYRTRMEIQKKVKYFTKVILNYRDNQMTIHLFETKKENLSEIVGNVSSILKMMIDLYRGRMNGDMYLFLLDKDKMLRGEHVGRDNVNSGLTHCTPTFNRIVLYRKEELYKVLIHELIHYYRVDFREECKDFFVELLGVRKEKIRGNLFESYTEILATIINHFWMDIVMRNGRKLDEIKSMLMQEGNYATKQFIKILKKQKFLSWKDFELNAHDYEESTNVLSYLFLKGLVFVHLDLFNNFLKRKTKNGFFKDSYLSDYKEMLRDMYVSKDFERYEKLWKNVDGRERKMRLTRYEIVVE